MGFSSLQGTTWISPAAFRSPHKLPPVLREGQGQRPGCSGLETFPRCSLGNLLKVHHVS